MKKTKTKTQIITKLHKDKFIDDRVVWNLLGSKFKKSELEEIDKTFRQHFKKSESAQQKETH